MTWLTETYWPAVLTGFAVEGVLFIMLLITGRGRLLWAMAGVLAVTLGLVAVERLVVTEREEVAQTLDEVAAALTENDLPRVLKHVASSAPQTRSAAQSAMARVTIRSAKVGSDLKIDISNSAVPQTATARFVAQFSGNDRGGQTPFDKVPQRLEVSLVKEDGQWRIAAYKLLPIMQPKASSGR